MDKEYYKDKWVTIYHGDCREILPSLNIKVDLLLTDPPQGITQNTGRRMHAYKNPEKSKGRIGWSGLADVTDYGDTTWDFAPLDLPAWEICKSISANQIVWGWNHLQSVLGKAPSILVWDKKCKNNWDDTFSDCEFAYCSRVMPDRLYRQLWMGALREGRETKREHPTQKPVELMLWCLSFFPNANTILDPYLGAGATLQASKELNRYSIGIEIEEKYCEIAAKRCMQESFEFDLPTQSTGKQVELSL